MSNPACLVAVVVLSGISGESALFAQQSNEINSVRMEKLSEFVLTGIHTNYDRLQRGVYRAYGRLEIRHGLKKLNDENRKKLIADENLTSHGWAHRRAIELTFFSAFDYQRDLYRIDRTESAEQDSVISKQKGKPEKTVVSPKQNREQPLKTLKWIRTPDSSIRTSHDQINEGPDSALIDITNPRYITIYRPFLDVRSLPLISYSGLTNLDSSYNNWYKMIRERMTVHEAVREGDNLYRVVWKNKGEVAKDKSLIHHFSTYWFDDQQGSMVVRRDLRAGKPQSKPSEWSETTWTNISDVWVPESYHAVRYFVGRCEELHLSFNWESVNQEIDEDIFSLKKLDLARGTRVLDARVSQDKPALIEIVGLQSKTVSLEADSNRSIFKLTLITVNLVIFAAFAFFFLSRRWKTRGRSNKLEKKTFS